MWRDWSIRPDLGRTEMASRVGRTAYIVRIRDRKLLARCAEVRKARKKKVLA